MEKQYRIVTTDIDSYIEMTDGEKVSIVPNDPANSDYQAYLKSLEENK